ncbi:hypothetical protein [Cohnella hongkongensis]|uniref:Uncharacterized protein n=1 Tax=Cohnella hongkongensis TaxID=178337 RepID=A0ABV9FAD7_9BACL
MNDAMNDFLKKTKDVSGSEKSFQICSALSTIAVAVTGLSGGILVRMKPGVVQSVGHIASRFFAAFA